MSNQVLALSFRPKTLDELVGQEKLAALIRGHHAQGRMPQAWMFIGETGAGKTTIARILALSLQCRHQDAFGCPCRDCLRSWGDFDINEINASDTTTVDELRKAISGSDYVPGPASKVRVYILDEAQRLSSNAQNLLLKYFEDCPKTTFWIVCTTNPQKILPTLQSRCTTYTVPSLDLKGVRNLVRRALKFVSSDKDSSDLADALCEAQIFSPRKIVNAVEKYVAGASAEDAAKVEVSTEFDTHGLCRSVYRGVWNDVAKQMKKAKPEDARAIRISVAAYLREIMLNDVEFGRLDHLSEGIHKLSSIAAMEDNLQLSATVATLYDLTRGFVQVKRKEAV